MKCMSSKAMAGIVSLLLLGMTAASDFAIAASRLPPLRAERSVNSPPLDAEQLGGTVTY